MQSVTRISTMKKTRSRWYYTAIDCATGSLKRRTVRIASRSHHLGWVSLATTPLPGAAHRLLGALLRHGIVTLVFTRRVIVDHCAQRAP